ncbi:MAG: hypothetical protein LJE85_04855 [Gammaproteobacteria bacterium]|nr:hypothetical protein [Gammaproteobacteria bacterium]
MKTITLRLVLVVFALLCCSAAGAKSLKKEEVPAPLQPWVDWVSQGNEHKRCPFLYSSFEQFYCAWPDELNLELDAAGGQFNQHWQVFEQSWLTLPGEARYWPVEVTLNGKPAVVISRNGAPAIEVTAGSYTIKGRFTWNALPESLAIPASTALLTVNLNGAPIDFPRIENSRLWMQIAQPQKLEDRFELQVFRYIDDTIPAQITFYLDMQVAGSAREVNLELPLTDKFIPLRLQSRLPARLDSNHSLAIQIKPGRWRIELTVRHIGPLNSLTLQKTAKPWPEQEVWVFNAHSQLRIVNLGGPSAIDPQQTLLPDNWKLLPAYRLQPGETLSFEQQRRGNPDPGPDNLTLNRTLWLNFAGDQYTIQDQISGVKKTDWRLEMNPPIELGQVNINGKPQYITRLQEGERTGIEVRQGNIQLTADSVLDSDIATFPATGWNQSFNNVSTTLNLPPGYQVFSISGADHVSATWVNRWSLLDIFLVLLITAAVFKLWGKALGAITLLTMTLIYHESNAPVWIWLFVILGFALLRVLPSGRFRHWAMIYRNATLIALLLVTIPFFIQQIRTSLYPQLESYYQPAVPAMTRPAAEADRTLPAPMARIRQKSEQAPFSAEESLEDNGLLSGISSAPVKKYDNKSQLVFQDPNAILQTGPGLPQWQWNRAHFSWSGPVDAQQNVRIHYIGPPTSSLLGWIRVSLVSLLILGLLNIKVGRHAGLSFPSLKAFTSMLFVGFTATALFCFAHPANAEFPSNTLLQELQNRLFTPPDCLPKCAEAQTLHIDLAPNKLTLELIVNSNQTVAIPLPAQADHWVPQKVWLNQQRAKGLIKDASGTLWLSISKGQHKVKLEGLLPAVDTVQLPLPLKPHHVTVTGDGWEIAGVHADGSLDAQLQFTRLAQTPQTGETMAGGTMTGETTAGDLNTAKLPPFAQVERNIILGLDWRVETTITRLGTTGKNPNGTRSGGSAIVLPIPLLPGESVTTEGIRVENGHVLINMSANQTSASWQSLLNMQDKLQLNAPQTTQWTEVWNLDISPIWHLQYQGIPVIRHQQADRWLPQWRPWPGEQVTLTLSRPQGVEGQTTTIDNSRIDINPGIRITNVSLTLHLRSSQGAQHPVVLPDNSTLQEVRIDNTPIPLRLQDHTLLLPVKPGAQQYTVTWQEPRGIGTRLNTSEVDIGAGSVNHSIALSVPRDRVVLFMGGPTMGPAVLIWGVVIVFLLLSIALAQFKNLVPLSYWQWALLSVGLVPISIESALVVIGWFFVTGFRRRLAADTEKWQFNVYQLVLVGFTLVTAVTLVYAVSQGLLGSPNMQIYGNGSTQHQLNWYQDINRALLSGAWMFTIPMFVFRILMLLWALWLAFSVIQWSKWFWECFSSHGYWRSFNWKKKSKPKSTPADKSLPATAHADRKYLSGSAADAESGDKPSD